MNLKAGENSEGVAVSALIAVVAGTGAAATWVEFAPRARDVRRGAVGEQVSVAAYLMRTDGDRVVGPELTDRPHRRSVLVCGEEPDQQIALGRMEPEVTVSCVLRIAGDASPFFAIGFEPAPVRSAERHDPTARSRASDHRSRTDHEIIERPDRLPVRRNHGVATVQREQHGPSVTVWTRRVRDDIVMPRCDTFFV